MAVTSAHTARKGTVSAPLRSAMLRLVDLSCAVAEVNPVSQLTANAAVCDPFVLGVAGETSSPPQALVFLASVAQLVSAVQEVVPAATLAPPVVGKGTWPSALCFVLAPRALVEWGMPFVPTVSPVFVL